MRPGFSSLLLWAAVYELVYVVVSLAVWLVLPGASPVGSIAVVRSRGFADAVLHIWLSNTSSFLLAAALVIIHPVLGVLAVAFSSATSGELLASWLAGYCSTAHMAYGVAESQAYILLWLLVVKAYYQQRGCDSLICRWEATLNHTARLLAYSFAAFLVLAVVEVAEVVVFG